MPHNGGLFIAINGKTYYLREDSAALIAALGDGYEYSEMVSCVYDGKDKTFAYDGITVSTVPVDGKDVTKPAECRTINLDRPRTSAKLIKSSMEGKISRN